MKRNKKHNIRSVTIRDIILSKESRKALRKFKDQLNDPVILAIENRNWYVPSDTYEFVDNKCYLEKSFHEFFNVPEDILIEIDSFQSDIMSFEKGVYPKYHK